MKTLLPHLGALALLLRLAHPAFAENPAPPASPVPAPATASPPAASKSAAAPDPDDFTAQAQYHLDVLMLAAPEQKILPLLPKLRNAGTIASAQASLLEMIGRGEAALIDWPELTSFSGSRAVAESINEQRYPVEFEQPQIPSPFDTGTKGINDIAPYAFGVIIPTTFETRNIGTTLEAEATVAADLSSVKIQISAQHVELLGIQEFSAGKNSKGETLGVPQPLIRTFKVSTNLLLRNGERRLLYVGKPAKPGDPVVLFIAGVDAIPPIGKR